VAHAARVGGGGLRWGDKAESSWARFVEIMEQLAMLHGDQEAGPAVRDVGSRMRAFREVLAALSQDYLRSLWLCAVVVTVCMSKPAERQKRKVCYACARSCTRKTNYLICLSLGFAPADLRSPVVPIKY
jgi:hypothetical protein